MEISSIVIFTVLVILSTGFIWLFPVLVAIALLGLLWGTVVLSVWFSNRTDKKYMSKVGEKASDDARRLTRDVSHYTHEQLSDDERTAKLLKEIGGL